MEDNGKIMVQDENGIMRLGKILSVFEMDNINYAVYMIDVDLENAVVLIGKLKKDEYDNDIIVSIDNDEYKNTIFQMVDNVIRRK